MLNQAIEYAKQNRERFLAEYKELVAIPSISTLSEHKPDMQRAVEWLAQQMREMGLQKVAIMPTAGHPVVYGEWLAAKGKPTVLVYGHYDVQPVDPESEWISKPFEPTVRGDFLYARGAADMKGNDHAFLKALQAYLKTSGKLPLNIKVLIEGEEEIGSPNLGAFMDQHKEMLKCDVSLNADSSILKPDIPSIVYGLRGLAYFELWVHGPAHDLHSGQYGGSVHNPAQALSELIAGMHDKNGRIALPGFYKRVRVLSKRERAEIKRVPHSDAEWREITGAPKLFGEKGFTTLERLGARPTLEVNGMLSGFTGEGAKTVLPAKAMAKISMRLVPDQDYHEVEKQLRAYLKKRAPKTIKWELKLLSSGDPAIVQRDTPAVRAAAIALKETFGKDPVFNLEGGSVPIVGMVQQKLGVDTLLLGFHLEAANLHAPNENQHLPSYYRGIEAYIRFFDAMAR